MSKPLPTVGEFEKVFLPGESPWAECIGHLTNGMWVGRIANHLFAQMSDADRSAMVGGWFGGTGDALPRLHNFKQDDIVIFHVEKGSEYEIWVPHSNEGGTA